MTRKLLIGAGVLVLIMALGICMRHRILIPLVTTGAPIAPNWAAAAPPNGQPFGDDGYFVVVQLDPQTFAIAEPYSWAKNFNYLIIGSSRALLFDAGVGHYDIRPVAKALTDKPLTFMPSHFHYDHLGQGRWERVAIVDLPHIRKQAADNQLTFTWGQYLGSAEGISTPTWQIDEWVKPGGTIDLGDRKLTLLYTPGHTDNSVSLFDQDRELMFTGDFISEGGLGAIYPTSSMGDYLQAANRVLEATSTKPSTVLHGAHGADEGTVPTQSRADVAMLREQLIKIKDRRLKGEGPYPVVYLLREDMTFRAEPRWLQDWSPTYPDQD